MNTSKRQILDLGVEIYRLIAKLPTQEEHMNLCIECGKFLSQSKGNK